MSDCDPCKPVDCANEDDFNLYNLQSGQVRAAAVPVGDETCKTCLPIDCSDGFRLDDDFRLYRLQSELYPLVLPFGLNVPGAEIRLPCCGTDIVRTVPQGLSDAEFRFLIGQMIDECALRTPFCADGGGTEGTDAPVQTIQLQLECCDHSFVYRQVSLTTPSGTIQAILGQMRTECSLQSGCSSSTLLVGNLSDSLGDAAVIILIAIDAVRDLFNAFISNNPTELGDAYTSGIAAVTNLEEIADTLRGAVTAILGSGMVITPELQAILDSINAFVGTLDSLAGLLRGLSDLALALSTGGDQTAAIQEIIDSITDLIGSSTTLDNAGNALLAVGGTPTIVLTANIEFTLADVLRVIAPLIDGWNASIQLVILFDLETSSDAAEELGNAFASGVPGDLLNAATHANEAATALRNASDNSAISTELQNAFDALADALFGLANVATAIATGVGLPAALLALVAIANALDLAAAALIATGDPALIALGYLLEDLADALRALSNGSGSAEDAADALQEAIDASIVIMLSAVTDATNAANDLDTAVTNLTASLTALETALITAVTAGILTPEQQARIQSDIDLAQSLLDGLSALADALAGLANVANAIATGVGLPAALAALIAIAVELENAAAALIATGDPEAAALAQVLLDLAALLRALALDVTRAEEAALALQRALLIALTLMLEVALRLSYDLDILLQLMLNDVFNNLPEITNRCCDGFIVRRTLTAGLTLAERNAIYISMILECAARCPPPTPPGGGFGPNGEQIPIQLFTNSPASCLAYCPDGSAFSWTIPAGRFIGQSQAVVDNQARAQACIEAPLYRVCLSNLPLTYCVGSAFSANITTGGLSSNAGNVWSVIGGVLPTGLSIVPHGTYASIAGTPTGTGTWNFRIQMVATNGARNSKAYTMEGLQVLPLTLPAFQVGTPYSQQLTLSGYSGGTITFAVTAGALPDGITLTAAGLLSGIPATASAFTFQITGTEV